jgi:hypothetical protein
MLAILRNSSSTRTGSIAIAPNHRQPRSFINYQCFWFSRLGKGCVNVMMQAQRSDWISPRGGEGLKKRLRGIFVALISVQHQAGEFVRELEIIV